MWPINWWLFWSFWRKISKEPASRHTGDTCSYGSSLWHHIPPGQANKNWHPSAFRRNATRSLSLFLANHMQTYTPCMSSHVQIWLNQRDQSHLSSAEFKYSPAMIPSTLVWPHIFVLVSTVVATSSSGERPEEWFPRRHHHGFTMELPATVPLTCGKKAP